MDIGKTVGSPSASAKVAPRQDMNPQDTHDHNNVDESVEDPETDSYPQQGINPIGEIGQTAKGKIITIIK